MQNTLLAERDAQDESVDGFTAGRYEVRFADGVGEIAAAQELRYRTLFVENGGCVSDEMLRTSRDDDEWDAIAHHVIVLDHKQPGVSVVGTLRLVSIERLAEGQGFYTEKAFDLHRLRGSYQRILELSRFCIDANGRSGSILMLIWKFTLQFILLRRFDVMIGCASFQGTDISRHTAILSYLYTHNLAPAALQPQPVTSNHIAIKTLLDEATVWDEVKHSVPTLLRGYLKIGAKISDCAIVDPIFNSTFVCIYVDAQHMILDNHRLVNGQHT